MTFASKDELLKARLPEAVVTIEGVGDVRVRGLSRVEAMLIQKVDDPEARERRILAYGMVEPSVTEAEAGRWQKASVAGELEPVTQKIAELSGILTGADKEAYKSLRGESGDGVRVLPSPETGHDGLGPTEPHVE
ncbi:MAG TPA: hypothetical protein VFB74_29805 [Kribbellaceae bacterium]|nr:hypothetical protein [Kribbellaceae bacterium]